MYIWSAWIADSSVSVYRNLDGVSTTHNSADEIWYFHLPIPVANTTNGKNFVLTKVTIHRATSGADPRWFNRFIREIQSDGTVIEAAFSNSPYTGTVTWDFADITTDENSRYALQLVTTEFPPPVGESDRIYGITIYGRWE